MGAVETYRVARASVVSDLQAFRYALKLDCPDAAVIDERLRVVPSEMADVRIGLLDAPFTVHVIRHIVIRSVDVEFRDSRVSTGVDSRITLVADTHAFREARDLYSLRRSVVDKAAVVVPCGAAHVVVGLGNGPVEAYRVRCFEVIVRGLEARRRGVIACLDAAVFVICRGQAVRQTAELYGLSAAVKGEALFIEVPADAGHVVIGPHDGPDAVCDRRGVVVCRIGYCKDRPCRVCARLCSFIAGVRRGHSVRQLLQKDALLPAVVRRSAMVVPSDRRHVIVGLHDLPLAVLYERLVVIAGIVRDEVRYSLIRAGVCCRVARINRSHALRQSAQRYLVHPAVIAELSVVIP